MEGYRFIIYNGQFPNQQLTSNWYSDQSHLTKMLFMFCNVRQIIRNKFNIDPFRNLTSIYFYGCPLGIEFHLDVFNGLINMTSFPTIQSKMINSNYGLFKPIKYFKMYLFISTTLMI